MKRIKQKRNRRSGFTLAETLLTVLILLLVTETVATGIPVARDAYEKVVLTANAEVLLSTTVSSLRNELGMAENVKIDGTKISYYNTARKTNSQICLNSDLSDGKTTDPDRMIMYQRYVSSDLSAGGSASRLVSKAASNKNLYVTYESASYSSGIVSFSGLKVCRETDTAASNPLTERDTLSVRVINYTGTA